MKRSFVMVVSVVLTLVLTTAGAVADCPQATTQECVAKCQEAIAYAKEHGTAALFEKINQEDGPFAWKGTYVFCVEDKTAKMLAHPLPFFQGMIGRSLLPIRDPDGREVWKRIMEDVQFGRCWGVYLFSPAPGKDPRVKVSYFEKVPDTNVIVAAGITP